LGLHAGEAIHDDHDLVGRAINLASRVTGAAAADEILVTEPFADHLSGPQPLVDRGLKTLKGFDQPRHLLALVWRDADEILLDH
jgi:class 3 adenylate cyclase